jgi:hypothetical protein
MSRRRSKTKKRGPSPSHDEGMLFDDPEHDDIDASMDGEWSGDEPGDELFEESFEDYDDELPFSPSRRRAQGYRDVDDWN